MEQLFISRPRPTQSCRCLWHALVRVQWGSFGDSSMTSGFWGFARLSRYHCPAFLALPALRLMLVLPLPQQSLQHVGWLLLKRSCSTTIDADVWLRQIWRDLTPSMIFYEVSCSFTKNDTGLFYTRIWNWNNFWWFIQCTNMLIVRSFVPCSPLTRWCRIHGIHFLPGLELTSSPATRILSRNGRTYWMWYMW